MARTKRRKSGRSDHSAAFVVGSIIGGLVGAVTALWKTPQSGTELRAKLASSLPAPGGGDSGLNFSTVRASQPASEVSVHQTAAQIEATQSVTSTPAASTTDPEAELPASGIGHAATTEELTRPPQSTT
jgi:gas vesicle protein